MCSACAILAMTAANGARHAVGLFRPMWVRVATVALIAAGLLFSSVGFSGSGSATPDAPPPVVAPR